MTDSISENSQHATLLLILPQTRRMLTAVPVLLRLLDASLQLSSEH